MNLNARFVCHHFISYRQSSNGQVCLVHRVTFWATETLTVIQKKTRYRVNLHTRLTVLKLNILRLKSTG
jgi:hypothetical protein